MNMKAWFRAASMATAFTAMMAALGWAVIRFTSPMDPIMASGIVVFLAIAWFSIFGFGYGFERDASSMKDALEKARTHPHAIEAVELVEGDNQVLTVVVRMRGEPSRDVAIGSLTAVAIRDELVQLMRQHQHQHQHSA